MKGLILAFFLGSGSLMASNDAVQDFALRTCDQVVERVGFGQRMNGFREITEEMQELMNYRIDLVQSYDFENMTDEEILAAKEEIRALVEEKAQELGIELPEQRFPSKGFGFGNSEEMIVLKDYAFELYESYDFENMTDEEIFTSKEEIKQLVEAKAIELGIDLEGDCNGQGFSKGKGSMSGFKGNQRRGRFGR